LDRIDQAIIDKIVETANAPDLEQVRKQEDNQTAAKIVELQHSLAELDKLKGIPHLQLTRSSIQQEIDELIRFKESSITADSTALQVIRHLQARNINFWYTLTQDEREILYLKLVDRVVLLGREAIQVELKQFAEPASNFDITQVTHYG